MFRLFEHLLPRSLAWRITTEKTLRRFFEGLAGMPADVRAFVDLAYLDLFPPSTRELTAWGTEFALSTEGSEATRRLRLAAAWRAQGGQSPDYIQTVLHAAGFTGVFVHEWWESGPPFVARDPRDYTTQALIGFYQCEGSTPWECFDSQPGDPLAPHCDDTLQNDPGYLVNLDLTRRAPPSVPDDPSSWPYFLYFSGETFPEPAPVDVTRIDEFKALILRISPSQQWLVTLMEPVMPDPLSIGTLLGTTTPDVGLLLASDGDHESVITLTDSDLTIETGGDAGLEIETGDLELKLGEGLFGGPIWRADGEEGFAKMGFQTNLTTARPSITGTTTEEQIDSLVSALAALGLMTDDR